MKKTASIIILIIFVVGAHPCVRPKYRVFGRTRRSAPTPGRCMKKIISILVIISLLMSLRGVAEGTERSLPAGRQACAFAAPRNDRQ